MSDGVTVDASAPLTFGGDVKTVLESPRATMPPKTLEEARNQPGRREQIDGIVKQIESQGIKYVFFQQVSVTGRVMGKGVVASLPMTRPVIETCWKKTYLMPCDSICLTIPSICSRRPG